MCELDAMQNVSFIIVYRHPNNDSSLFINELERILTMLKSENRVIFLIGDFNYDKPSILICGCGSVRFKCS